MLRSPAAASGAALVEVTSEATMRFTLREQPGRLDGDDREHQDEGPDALVIANVETEVVVRRGDLLDEPDDHAAHDDATEAAEATEDRRREPSEHHEEAQVDVDRAERC